MCVLGFLVICSRSSFVVLNPPFLGTSSRSLYLNKPVFTCKRQLKSINMHVFCLLAATTIIKIYVMENTKYIQKH